MKIILRRKPENKPKQIVCLHCTSILEVETRDILRRERPVYQREYNQLVFKCPVCENETTASNTNLGWQGIV